MITTRHVGPGALLFAGILAGCAADLGDEKAGAADIQEVVLARPNVVGTIATGETRTTRYTHPPRLWAYRFTASGGETIDAWVRGTGSADAMVWVTDARRNVLAFNDDADATTLDAHVSVRLPRTAAPAEYLLVFREYHLRTATFRLSLGPRDFTTCRADADCVRVPMVACCSHGRYTAVNAATVDAWREATQCRPPYPPCAPPPDPDTVPPDTRVARCNTATNRCELAAPAGCEYGGRRYEQGASFPSTDGCNTCTCGPEGSVACTRRACLCNPSSEPHRRYLGTPETCPRIRYTCNAGEQSFSNPCGCGCERAGCTYGGSTYPNGASFPSTDGCNTCTCGADGNVACTERACLCDPAREPQRRYVGTPETCPRIRFACNAGERYFSNACGCGCEPTP